MHTDFGIRPINDETTFDVSGVLEKLQCDHCVVIISRKDHMPHHDDDDPDELYLVCTDREIAVKVKEWADTGNTDAHVKFYFRTALLEVTSRYIVVRQEADQEAIDRVQAILLPFLKSTPHRIFCEYGEITERYRPPEKLFT